MWLCLDGRLKDVTKHYEPQWLSCTHKQRVVEPWWQALIRPYLNSAEEDYQEDELVQGSACIGGIVSYYSTLEIWKSSMSRVLYTR